MLTELWSEKFKWFDPSPIEPFNLGAEKGGAERGPKDAAKPKASASGGGGSPAEGEGETLSCWRMALRHPKWRSDEIVRQISM